MAGTGSASRWSSTTAISPARAAAPVSPTSMPASAWARIARRQVSSSTATRASNVAVTVGRASIDASPQFSPAISDRCGPGTSTR